MYTENLVNLFGGGDDIPKKSNNMIIIIIICLVVLGGTFFMMNNKKKEDNKKDKKEATYNNKLDLSNNEICSKYSDDASGVPVECYEKLWKENGCREPIPDPYKNILVGTKYSTIKDNINTIATSTDNATRSMCFGDDSSRSYLCSSLPDNAKFIPNKCIQELWNNGKCTKPIGSFNNGYIGDDNYTYSKVKDYINNKITKESECGRIEDCNSWKDTDTGIPLECLKALWASEGCTKPLPSEYSSNFNSQLANHKVLFGYTASSTSPKYKSRCK